MIQRMAMSSGMLILPCKTANSEKPSVSLTWQQTAAKHDVGNEIGFETPQIRHASEHDAGIKYDSLTKIFETMITRTDKQTVSKSRSTMRSLHLSGSIDRRIQQNNMNRRRKVP